MSAIADLVTLLGGVGGLSSDLIAKAVDLAQKHAEEVGGCRPSIGGSSADSAMEKRRAYDRGRQAEIRRLKKEAASLTTSSLPSSTDSQEKKEGVVGRARGSRLPVDWQPTQADLNFAVCHLPEGQIAEEVEKFRDYWHARAGPGGVKLDWSATWRTWVRRAKGNGQNGHRPHPISTAFNELIADAEARARAADLGDADPFGGVVIEGR